MSHGNRIIDEVCPACHGTGKFISGPVVCSNRIRPGGNSLSDYPQGEKHPREWPSPYPQHKPGASSLVVSVVTAGIIILFLFFLMWLV